MIAPACPKHDTGGGPCFCPIEPQAETMPNAIEYGGVMWQLEHTDDSIQYRSLRGQVAMCVSLYASGYSVGKWHSAAEFEQLVPREKRPDNFDLRVYSIVDTREDAMCFCINAFDEWLENMQSMLLIFKPDDQYAQGFRAGQEDIKAKIAEVVL